MDVNQQAFFALLRAGLWSGQRLVQGFKSLKVQGSVDWKKVYQLAMEQSVQGLALQGIDELRVEGIELDVPKTLLLQWIGEVRMIEQRNKDMNAFIAELIKKLRKNDIYAILVMGQGIAQCYARPLWRSAGDIDFCLSEEDYGKAGYLLKPLASALDEEEHKRKHLALTIEGWIVELHGTLRTGLWAKLDIVLDSIQNEMFYGGAVRTWTNGDTLVFLPRPDEDAFFIFAHILQHFYIEGIGLRQICDWTRLLYQYHDTIDVKRLEYRLKKAGIFSEWKVFAVIAVDYIGLEEFVIPFYDSSKSYSIKARKVIDLIFETGSFGYRRDKSYKQKYATGVSYIISFCRHTKDAIRRAFLFPCHSMFMWVRIIRKALSVNGD